MGIETDFDFGAFRRKRWLMIGGGALAVVAVTVVLIVILGQGGDETPSGAQLTVEPTRTLLPSQTPSLQPTTAGPPTSTFTPEPTPTLEPYQYVVQPDDTLYYILQLFGYRELSVVAEVLQLNGMADENDLHPDQILLIPRQTPTPGPTLTPSGTPDATGGTPVSPAGDIDYTGCSPDNRCQSPDGLYWMHEVVEGETCAYLALAYDTTVPDILRDNGLTDSCFIRPGDVLKVFIRVTLTPTLTPTGGPDSTATLTPTLSPPSLLAPADGASIARDVTVVLQWAAFQPLPTGHYYLVEVTGSTGEPFKATTRSNIYRLPAELQPQAGQSLEYQWRVSIVDGSSVSSEQVGGMGETWAFRWGP